MEESRSYDNSCLLSEKSEEDKRLVDETVRSACAHFSHEHGKLWWRTSVKCCAALIAFAESVKPSL